MPIYPSTATPPTLRHSAPGIRSSSTLSAQGAQLCPSPTAMPWPGGPCHPLCLWDDADDPRLPFREGREWIQLVGSFQRCGGSGSKGKKRIKMKKKKPHKKAHHWSVLVLPCPPSWVRWCCRSCPSCIHVPPLSPALGAALCQAPGLAGTGGEGDGGEPCLLLSIPLRQGQMPPPLAV